MNHSVMLLICGLQAGCSLPVDVALLSTQIIANMLFNIISRSSSAHLLARDRSQALLVEVPEQLPNQSELYTLWQT